MQGRFLYGNWYYTINGTCTFKACNQSAPMTLDLEDVIKHLDENTPFGFIHQLKMAAIHQRMANLHFGANHLSSKYDKNFQYKDVTNYSLEEWIENIFISMNENVALKAANSNTGVFMDKRQGYSFSRMGLSLTTENQNSLMQDEKKCRDYLVMYWNKKNN